MQSTYEYFADTHTYTHIHYVKTDGKSIIISYVFIYTLKCANAFHQEDYV